jgi:hypothetical protein
MFPKSTSISARASVATLVAWLSVCLVVAGQGRQLQTDVREIWLRMGCFGLPAAVGLAVAGHARRVQKKKAQQTRTQRHIARKLAEITARKASISRVAEAVGRICPDIDCRDLKSLKNRSEARLFTSHSVWIRPLTRARDAAACYAARSLRGTVLNISASGVGLVHKERIDRSRFLVEFSLCETETITMVVELLWQQRLADGPYHSGGKWVDVSVAGDANEAVVA